MALPGAARFVGVPRCLGLKTISTGCSIGFVNAAAEGWAGALFRWLNPAVCTSAFAARCGAGGPLLNPPVVTAPFAAPRCEVAAFPNPPVVTAAAAWLVRAAFVRSKRPRAPGGRGISALSTGRSIAGATAGTSAGSGAIGLVTIGTGSGFGASALANACIGRGAGGAGRRGTTTGANGSLTGSVAAKKTILVDRMRDVGGISAVRIVTTIRTAPMACKTTLSHRPVFERPGGRVLDRASSNRNDMCV